MYSDVQNSQRFIERLPIGIVVLDSALNMVMCNNLALELLNVAIENCITGNFVDALEYQPLKQLIISATHNTAIQKNHLVLTKGDMAVSCTVTTIENEEQQQDLIVMVEDATRLQELERMKSEFMGSLLHRIRSPLATLKTSLSMVQNEKMGILPVDVAEIMSMGYHEVNRLSVLVNDMRDLFQIEANQVGKDMALESFTVQSVLNRVLKDFDKKDSSVAGAFERIKLSGEGTCAVAGDFGMVKRIMSNILKNALLYTGQNTPVEVIVRKADGNLQLQVRDQGPGIASEKQSLIFTKYFREDTITTRTWEGNGLGLFIAKAFTEALGGSLYLESSFEKGTTVSLTLPLAKE